MKTKTRLGQRLRIFRTTEGDPNRLHHQGEFIETGDTVELEPVEETKIYDHNDQKVLRGHDKKGEFFVLAREFALVTF